MAKMIIVEGSPEELLVIAKGLDLPEPSHNLAAADTRVSDVGVPGEVADQKDGMVSASVTVEFALLVLSRRPLSENQTAVLAGMARRAPEWVAASTLAQEAGLDTAGFRGVMGALGRRIVNTEGYREGFDVWKQDWDYGAGEYKYLMATALVEAMRSQGLL